MDPHGLKQLPTKRQLASNEVTNDHAGNTPLISPDGEGEAAVDEAYLCWTIKLNWLLLHGRTRVAFARYVGSGAVDYGFIPQHAGGQYGFLHGVERDVTVFLSCVQLSESEK